MRRAERARVCAGAAVVTEVRQIAHIAIEECRTKLHGREYRAEPFAVPARIANRELTFGLETEVAVKQEPPPLVPRSVRRPTRSSGRLPRDTPS